MLVGIQPKVLVSVLMIDCSRTNASIVQLVSDFIKSSTSWFCVSCIKCESSVNSSVAIHIAKTNQGLCMQDSRFDNHLVLLLLVLCSELWIVDVWARNGRQLCNNKPSALLSVKVTRCVVGSSKLRDTGSCRGLNVESDHANTLSDSLSLPTESDCNQLWNFHAINL